MIVKSGYTGIILLFMFVVMFVVVCIDIYSNTSNYKNGYDAGYKENNITKYNAAQQIYEQSLYRMNKNEQYAKGYRDGYNKYKRIQEYKLKQKQQDEIEQKNLAILGFNET
jgi:hypothetical protein